MQGSFALQKNDKMKRLLIVSPASATADSALLLLRIGLASMMLVHGLPKLLMLFSGGPVQFPPILGMSPALSLSLTVFAEVFCSLFILFGLGTRFATIPLIITMLVAILVVHAADPFNVKELAVHYLLGYLVLLVAGSGKYSLDYRLQAGQPRTFAAQQKTTAVLQ